MSAWSAEDIEKLKAAILALATGTAVLTVRYGGPPPREVTYQQQNLQQMRELLASMEASAVGSRRRGYMRTSKGFRR